MPEESAAPDAAESPAASEPVAATVPTVQAAPAPEVPAVVVTSPVAAMQASAPVVTATAAPAKPADPTEDVNAKLREQLELATRATQQIQAIADKDRKGRLLGHLRQRGADGSILTDANLMQLAPDVDPDTPEGAAAVEAWQQANPHLFVVQAVTQQQQTQMLVDAIPKAPGRKLFGDKFVAGLVAHNAEIRRGRNDR